MGKMVSLSFVVVLAFSSATARAAEDEVVAQRVRIDVVRGAEMPPVAPATAGAAVLPGSTFARRITGTLLDAAADTITVRLEGRDTIVTLPRASVARVQVSEGLRSRGSSAARGAKVGVLVGGGLGALAGVLSGDDTCSPSTSPYDSPYAPDFSCLFSYTKGEMVVIGGTVFGVLGAAAGALVGATTPDEIWRTAPELGGRKAVSVGFAPLPGRGLAVKLAVAF